jgi:hypothetical protein
VVSHAELILYSISQLFTAMYQSMRVNTKRFLSSIMSGGEHLSRHNDRANVGNDAARLNEIETSGGGEYCNYVSAIVNVVSNTVGKL